MDVPQISEIWSRACHEPFPMEYERYRFLQRLQGDSRKYVACAWCLELHPRKRNCSVGCASRFASERRIKVDETTCEWQIMHNGRSNGIYISNFKNVDEESEEFITHNADQVSERSDGTLHFYCTRLWKRSRVSWHIRNSRREIHYHPCWPRQSLWPRRFLRSSAQKLLHQSVRPPEVPRKPWPLGYGLLQSHEPSRKSILPQMRQCLTALWQVWGHLRL